MLEGLERMVGAEIREVAKLAGLPESTPEDAVIHQALAWLAYVVGQGDLRHESIERGVLEWLATRWGIEFKESTYNDDIERNLRLEMSRRAVVSLSPVWRIACALLAAERSRVSEEKMDMLMRAASLAIPSVSVVAEKRREWEDLMVIWGDVDPRPELEGDCQTLAARPQLAAHALDLGLVVAMVDGRLSPSEENLARDLGTSMGVGEDMVRARAAELNQIFWSHQNRRSAATPNTRNLPLKAAWDTLESSGCLSALVGAVGKDLGEAEGGGDAGSVVHLLHYSIVKQHLRLVEASERAEAELERLKAERSRAEKPRAEAAPPPPPPPDSAATAFKPLVELDMVKNKPGERRSIKLD